MQISGNAIRHNLYKKVRFQHVSAVFFRLSDIFDVSQPCIFQKMSDGFGVVTNGIIVT